MGQDGHTVEVEAGGVQGHPLYMMSSYQLGQHKTLSQQNRNNSNKSVRLVEFVTEVPGTKETSLDLGPLEEQEAA